MKIFFKSKSLFQCSKYQKKSNIISNIFKISNDYYNFYTKTNNLNAEYDVYDIFKTPVKLSESLSSPIEQLNQVTELDKIKSKQSDKEKRKGYKFLNTFNEKDFLENKTRNFSLSNDDYKVLLLKEFTGSVKKFIYNDQEVYLIGTAYNRISLSNIYKLLNTIRPNIILTQLRPDKILSGISANITNLTNNKITEEDYINFLIRDPWEIQPSISQKENAKNKLKAYNIFLNYEKNKEIRKHIEQKQETFIEIKETERISNEALSVMSLWGEQKNVKIMACDLPEYLQYEKLANELTVVELQNMFNEIFVQLPNNPDFEPNNSFGCAINLYPDRFLNNSDSIMSQLIHSVSKRLQLESINKNNNESNKNDIGNDSNENNTTKATIENTIVSPSNKNKMLAFVGYGQTESIPLFLKYNVERSSIKSLLTSPKAYDSILYGKDSLEILVEKWVLIKIIMQGVNIKEGSDTIIDYLIKKYVRLDLIQSGFNNEKLLLDRTYYLFSKLYDEKLKLALSFMSEGTTIKRKDFMKKILKDPYLNSQLD